MDNKHIDVSLCDEGKSSIDSFYVDHEIDKVEAVIFNSDSSKKVVFVGHKLSVSHKRSLVDMLTKNKEVFAYSHSDTLVIDTRFISHSLKIDKPIK